MAEAARPSDDRAGEREKQSLPLEKAKGDGSYSTLADVLGDLYQALGVTSAACAKQKSANIAELAKLETEEMVIRKHLYAAEQLEAAAYAKANEDGGEERQS